MQNDEPFETNLKLIEKVFPKNIQAIRDADVVGMKAQEETSAEAERWFRELDLIERIETLIIYGVGLGGYFDAARDWLEAKTNRFLIFLEDDFSVIKCFCETNKATNILSHPRVLLVPFKTPSLDPEDFNLVVSTFAGTPYIFTQSKLYHESRDEQIKQMKIQLKIVFEQFTYSSQFFEPYYQITYFRNVYANLFYLPQMPFGHDLKNRFKGVPAVICGAGPSLAKHFEVLKNLQDRALIFGAGTAMNVLNKKGIIPHFGAGIDPHQASYSRIRTNYAYEVPYFYSNSFHHEAFQTLHGPKLFIQEGEAYGFETWLIKQLPLEPFELWPPSISTTHACLMAAFAFGCHPIVFVGLDLAYTDQKRYPPGVEAHPLDSKAEHFAIRNFSEDIPVRGNDGVEIFSSIDWLREATLYSEFARDHPETAFINCTEGGMKIPKIPHQPFREVIDKRMTQSYDLLNWVHKEIQTCRRIDIAEDELMKHIEQWKKSIEACLKILDQGQSKMEEQIFYQNYLNMMERPFSILSRRDDFVLKYRPDTLTESERQAKEFQLKSARIAFLKEFANIHLNLLNQGLKEYKPSALTPVPDKEIEKDNLAKGTFVDHQRHGENFQYYSSGQLYSLLRFHQGQQHGKQEYYYENGNLKTLMTFHYGELDGIVQLYYSNAQLKREIHFRQGKLHGVERMWTEQGQLILESEYRENQPVGASMSWSADGRVIEKKVHMPEGLSRETTEKTEELDTAIKKLREKFKDLSEKKNDKKGE